MAGMDYAHCEVCHERLMYDPDNWFRENEIVCKKCYDKAMNKIKKYEKILMDKGLLKHGRK